MTYCLPSGLLIFFFCARAAAGSLDIVSHKGLHIPFRTTPGPNDCVASFIDDPMNFPSATRYFLENTASAISAAFDVGATRVSINPRVTADGHVVLFHDANLDCRTNGAGPVSAKTLPELKSLNVGWNYSADGGLTFPWRHEAAVDKKLVTIPTLEEVFDANPGRAFWVVLRPKDSAEAGIIFAVMKNFPDIVRKSALFAPSWVNDQARQEIPELRIPRLDPAKNKACLKGFVTSRPLPDECADLDVIAPIAYYANLGDSVMEFSAKLKAMNPPSSLNIGSEYGGYVDDVPSAMFVKDHQDAFQALMTDRIDTIGPIFSSTH